MPGRLGTERHDCETWKAQHLLPLAADPQAQLGMPTSRCISSLSGSCQNILRNGTSSRRLGWTSHCLSEVHSPRAGWLHNTVVKHRDQKRVSPLGLLTSTYGDTPSFDILNSLSDVSNATLPFAVYNMTCRPSRDASKQLCKIKNT